MTSTPVMDVGFMTGRMTAVGTKSTSDSGFQEVWNNRTNREAGHDGEESGQVVRKTPGDSLKARDEHRARTEKREPSRDVEERADIPEEIPEEALEVLGTAAAEMIQQIADTLGVDTNAVTDTMESLGMEQTDVLNPQNLGELILSLAGAEDASQMITDESLYGSYRELMAQLENVLQESAETLEQPPEQIPELLKLIESGKPSEQAEAPVIYVETTGETADVEMAPEENGKATADAPEPFEASAGKRETGTDMVNAEISTESQKRGSESGETESRGNEGHSEGQKDRNLNLFVQNLKTEQSVTSTQQNTVLESPWTADTENIMRQIMDYMKINLKPDMSSMEMQLHPASLGTLQVHVASKGGVVTANFVTQNEAVKAALESQMIQLKTQFEEQGVRVEAIEVTVQTHEFERNLDQGRGNGGQGQEPSRRGRTRRLNLNDSLIAEELEEEDALAKNIMENNGNTVDYTA